MSNIRRSGNQPQTKWYHLIPILINALAVVVCLFGAIMTAGLDNPGFFAIFVLAGIVAAISVSEMIKDV